MTTLQVASDGEYYIVVFGEQVATLEIKTVAHPDDEHCIFDYIIRDVFGQLIARGTEKAGPSRD